MPSTARNAEHQVLVTALDHVWRWYSLRQSQIVQLVNFSILAIAIMSAAYASALTAKLYTVAGVVGLLGIVVAIGFELVIRRLRHLCQLAEEPLRIIEDRLASQLTIDTLRIMSTRNVAVGGLQQRLSRLHAVGAAVIGLAGGAAALFAWAGR